MEAQRGQAVKSFMEVLSAVAPIICLVDCIVIPFALAVLPLFGVGGLQKICHGVGDQFLALLVLLICTPVIVPGYFKHRKPSVLIFMTTGFALIFLANFFGHLFDESVHSVLSVIGSVCLIKANFDNKRFKKSCHCCTSEAPARETAHRH